ncbi:MAG: short-chain dehydrogenase [Fidelibacterota bacterium]
MVIKNRKVMVLGGWGLVGSTVCKYLMTENPSMLIIASLRKREVEEAEEAIKKEFGNSRTEIRTEYGNLFVRESLKDLSPGEILSNSEYRRQILEDVLPELNNEILERSFFYKLCQQYKPDIIIDCVNTATAIAYQDIYSSAIKIDHLLNSSDDFEKLKDEVERHLCLLYIPQLVRHIQILNESMIRTGVEIYIKIGTSGTGGMGLNIPYTHSEEKPSRVLLSKSGVAGAHTLLLFLMGRTPKAPIVKEIKPTAAIAWKRIGYGPVLRGGEPIRLYDCPPDRALKLENKLKLSDVDCAVPLKSRNDEPEVLKSVFIDAGENGCFARSEFEVLTLAGQMEFVTPEEIAKNIIYEIKGGNTGHDIINALDNATMGPTYRAGFMRYPAVEKMKKLEMENNIHSVAFEMLGPPRLTKLLYEAYLIRLICGRMDLILSKSPQELYRKMEHIILNNSQLRSRIISVGIPILLSDGKSLLRGPEMKIPSSLELEELEISPEKIDLWAETGWVDLRESNARRWLERFKKIFKEIESLPEDDTSSRFERDRDFWFKDESINLAKIVGWILVEEEKGERAKD